MTSLLISAFIYLFAAVVAVPISKRLGLGSVLGYLLAGVAIGPILGLVGQEAERVQHVAEFGVVMMLFLIGLELDPKMLWALRTKLLGLGGLQVILSIGAIAGIAHLFDFSWQMSIAIGCVLAVSSTAIVLQTLGEKHLLNSPGGQSSFSVLLFQDIAIIPILAFLPMLASPELIDSLHSAEQHSGNLLDGVNNYVKTLITFSVIGSIIFGGYFLARPIFRYIAASRMREIFTAFALALVIGIAAMMSAIGLSPALGTFLAGVVLANSEYRHELESNLEPFKGLLLGLFFITVGADINFSLLFNDFTLILGITLLFILIKAILLWGLGLLFRLDRLNRNLFALSLAPAGEFGFVLLSFSQQNGILPREITDKLLLAVAISMLLTPFLFIAYDKLIVPRASHQQQHENDTIKDQNDVLIIGHGRYGQIISGMLMSCGYKPTVIDYDATLVEGLSRFGLKTYFGDGSRSDLLETAGIAKAKLLVIALDDKEQAIQIAHFAHHFYPNLPIITRAYDRLHVYDLYRAGARNIVRETFDSAIRSGRLALEQLGMDKEKAKHIAEFYYHRDRHGLAEMASLYDPEISVFSNERMIARAKELEQETKSMMLILLAGGEVDWKPGEENRAGE
ncbi:monovalent cation:proton antiporter-2 (CPA2) family protein [Avibacterium sp. 21-586]|uniref:monovalent cation:proton antiporter-2 (CPA2) family protein n=1 Tax=Avibacterium sp. 21-586 TaxID=2911534 RepID=UPI0022459591|nr:monovalent cation:proton antiporter-2 (CPA2) family protein [Avibacterium sp. 21-586]MCW9711049.1 monovalent cation:proton antiporter-2 (CPA2) family protein [Avibacterium sp. 21-586]